MADSLELIGYRLGSGATAFTTTRQGGVSQGNYASLNLSLNCGDNPEHVMENRRRLCRELGIGEKSLIVPAQVHGCIYKRIDESFATLRADDRENIVKGVDALTTNVPGICIGVSTADCIPILLYSPERRAAFAIHAGWRGTAARITERCVRAMCEEYRATPGKLLACIGPGISQEHFEVGDEVYDAFLSAGFNMPLVSRREQKWHINLQECNRAMLLSSGLSPENITTAGLCTYANPGKLFSARRLGTASGRLFTGIVIR